MKLRFKPEFRNRLDAVVIFQPFTGGDLSRVVEAEVALLQERINKQAPGGKKFTITVDKSARDKLLAATGNNVAELKRVIAAQINTPLGRLYNTGKITAGCTLTVTYSEKIGNYEFAMQPGVPEPAKTDATATGDKDQSKTGAGTENGTGNGSGTKDGGSGKPTLHLPKKDAPKTNLPAVVKNTGEKVPPNLLQKYAVQALAKSFYDAEEKADEVMHYLTDVLTVDVLYEVLTHKEPYSFSVMVMASLEQLELLKLKLPYVVYRKQGS